MPCVCCSTSATMLRETPAATATSSWVSSTSRRALRSRRPTAWRSSFSLSSMVVLLSVGSVLAGGFTPGAGAGGRGQRQGDVAVGEVAEPGELPAADHEGRVVAGPVVDDERPRVLEPTPAVVESLPADGAEGGGVAAGL